MLFLIRSPMIAIMLLLYSLFAVVLLLYGAFICYLTLRLVPALSKRKKTGIKTADGALPDVSIVIPFRNEAHNLERLIGSLDSQTYKGKYEIILIDDGSTDNYNAAASSRKWQHPVKILPSVFSEKRGLTSKQQALDTGIKATVSDYIACTDADMLLEPRWLESLMLPALSGADLVFGHTVVEGEIKSSNFVRFQKFQIETLFAIAYAFNHAGLAGSCMGNNLLFSRKAYLESGGFDAVGYSIVEDMDLMLSFRRKKLHTTATEPFTPTARTYPATTFPDYLQQLLRWTRGGFRKNPVLLSANVLLSAQNILLAFSLCRMLPGFIAVASAVNLLLTWIFIAAAFRRMASGERTFLFPLFYMLYLAESAVLFLFSVLNKKIIWKNRRIA